MKIISPGDSIGYYFVNVCKVRRNKMNEMLVKYGIHAGQDILLFHLLEEDGQTVSKLVENVCVQHATLSNMINRMECNGFITKVKDEVDQRVSRVFLTDLGKEAIEKVHGVWKELEKQTVEGLSVEEKIILKRLLQHVLRNFE